MAKKRVVKSAVKPEPARVKSASMKRGRAGPKKTPKCVECSAYPKTAYGYALHLLNHHKSTLKSHGIYLVCSCGMEVRSKHLSCKHDKQCDGHQFSLLKLKEKLHPNPKCLFNGCESRPSTTSAYHHHLNKYHKTTLRAHRKYLVCGCGTEVRIVPTKDTVHKCASRTFTLHDDVKTTPKCTICEAYPSTPHGYACHLKIQHNSTLKENGVYLLCGTCGKEIRSIHYDAHHIKQCEGQPFALHKIKKETGGGRARRVPPSTRSTRATRQPAVVVAVADGEEGDEEEETGDVDMRDEAENGQEREEREEEILEDIEDEEGDEEEEMENGDERVDEVIEDIDEEDEEGQGDEKVGEAEAEVAEDKLGCHYPVEVGDILNEKYQVVEKLGSGGYSTVWLGKAVDTGRKFAIKIGVSDGDVAEGTRDEIRFLKAVIDGDAADPSRDKVIQLLDSFTVSSETGDHVCCVLEPLDCDMLKLIEQSEYEGIGIEKVKTVIRQVLEGLNYLHVTCQIIHTDIKPENILVSIEDDEITQVKITDFGNVCYTHEHYVEMIQTREYRSPEVLIGAEYSTSADIWSTACVAFELATGDFLFNPKKDADKKKKNADHLRAITATLGPIPAEAYKKGKHWADYYDEDGDLLHAPDVEPFPLKDKLLTKYEWSDEDASQFASFLTPMLNVAEEKRATAAQCLQHAWLQPQPHAAHAAARTPRLEEEEDESAEEEEEEESE